MRSKILRIFYANAWMEADRAASNLCSAADLQPSSGCRMAIDALFTLKPLM